MKGLWAAQLSTADQWATIERYERDLEDVKNKIADVEAEINSTEQKIESLEQKIESIEPEIQEASANAEMENPPHPGAQYWIDEKKQLWDEKKQLRDIKKLWRDIMKQQGYEKKLLRDKEKQLGDELKQQLKFQESEPVKKLVGIAELAKRIGDPSTFANLYNWPDVNGIYHHRPPGPAHGKLHVSLFSAALGNFQSKCEKFAEASKSQDTCDFVEELCIEMSNVYYLPVRKECFNNKLNEFLANTGYKCRPAGEKLNSAGSILVETSNFHLMLLNVQVKNEKGLTSSDCVMENLAHFIKHWGGQKHKPPHPLMRSFLLSLEDCVLHVHGVVVVDGEVRTDELCPPLTLCLQPDRRWNMERIVVWADALRDGLKELHAEMIDDQPPDPNFPYLVELEKPSGGSLKFKYEKELQRRVFLARLEDSDELVVVKFSPYGNAVKLHNLLSEHGFAPRLLAHGVIQSTWYVSVSEYTPDTAGIDPFTKGQKKQLKKAVKLMGDNGWVHGDFRHQNILRVGQKQRIHIIDFEFSGREDEVVYPAFLNLTNIKWPDGVAAGLPLKKEHDEEMLKRICGD